MSHIDDIRINRSEAHSRAAHDLLEQAEDSSLNSAMGQVLEAIRCLRLVIRDQQHEIDRLLDRIATDAAAKEPSQ